MENLLIHNPHVDQVLKKLELGPHTLDFEELQEPTFSEGINYTQVIPSDDIIILIFSFPPLQHHDGQNLQWIHKKKFNIFISHPW
jgi:hypothetical protein